MAGGRQFPPQARFLVPGAGREAGTAGPGRGGRTAGGRHQFAPEAGPARPGPKDHLRQHAFERVAALGPAPSGTRATGRSTTSSRPASSSTRARCLGRRRSGRRTPAPSCAALRPSAPLAGRSPLPLPLGPPCGHRQPDGRHRRRSDTGWHATTGRRPRNDRAVPGEHAHAVWHLMAPAPAQNRDLDRRTATRGAPPQRAAPRQAVAPHRMPERRATTCCAPIRWHPGSRPCVSSAKRHCKAGASARYPFSANGYMA